MADILIPHSPWADVDFWWIVDDVAEELVGIKANNNTEDVFRFELHLGPNPNQQFKISLPPHDATDREMLIPPPQRPAASQTRPPHADPANAGEPLEPSDPGVWYFTYVLVAEREYTDPEPSSPLILSVTTTEWNGQPTAHAAALPPTVNANDGLLFLFLAHESATVTTPTGFTLIGLDNGDAASFKFDTNTYIKVAVGDEGGGTADAITSPGSEGIAQVYRIDAGTWKEATASIEISASVTGNSTTPDPDSLTPSWGSGATTWIAVTGVGDNPATLDAIPTNYSDSVYNAENGTRDYAMGSARRSVTGSSEDPDTFTLSAGEPWNAWTTGIRDTIAAAGASDLGGPEGWGNVRMGA